MSINERQYEHVRSKLNALLNHHVAYGVSDFVVVDYKFRNDKFYVEVSDRDELFEFTIDRAVDFIREVKLLDAPKPLIQETKKEITIIPDDNITEQLKKTVLDCIEKLKYDKGYISQANAINAQIQTLINLKKVEIEANKLQRQLSTKLN